MECDILKKALSIFFRKDGKSLNSYNVHKKADFFNTFNGKPTKLKHKG